MEQAKPAAETTTLATKPAERGDVVTFGDMIMKVVGDREIHGKFIGMHTVGPGYLFTQFKGCITSRRFIQKQEVAFMSPTRVRVANSSKYKPHQGKKECARRLRTSCDCTRYAK